MQITSIIIHYKRPENVKLWMNGIRNQTIPSKVIVWDNSGDYPKGSGEDVLITSTENIYCQARFLIAGIAKTPYIYNQDDDLAINDPKLFEKFIEVSEKHPNSVIGWNGRIFSDDINWEQAYSFPGKGFVDEMPIDDESSIDMINIGVSFMRTQLINQLHINPFQYGGLNKKGKNNKITEIELKYADDIWASHYIYKKRTMPFKLIDHYDWLNEFEERKAALSKQPEHMKYRDRICRRYFK